MMSPLEQTVFDIVSRIPTGRATAEGIAREAGTSVHAAVRVVGCLSNKNLVTIRRGCGDEWEIRPVIWKRTKGWKRTATPGRAGA